MIRRLLAHAAEHPRGLFVFIQQIVIDTLETTPKDATHWSTRAMAQRDGISRQTVSEIWRAFGLKPWEIDRHGRPDRSEIMPGCGEGAIKNVEEIKASI